jgi:hypothetical protein
VTSAINAGDGPCQLIGRAADECDSAFDSARRRSLTAVSPYRIADGT